MTDEQKYANIVDMVSDFNNDKNLILQLTQQKIADLEAKLKEKEVEIKKLNACVDFYKSYSVSFQEKVIDELERVKEKILPEISSYVKKEFVVKEFDNQIKQSSEMSIIKMIVVNSIKSVTFK